MDRIRRLALLTTLATLLLISVGGFVRAAGAGLGCDSWPKCFPWSWLPPFSVDQLPDHVDASTFSFTKAWIEYINRLVGVVIGFMILATWWAVYRDGRQRKDLFPPTTLAVLLVGFQGWFGGQVVKHELDPRLVSVHLVIALILAAILIYVAVSSRRPTDPDASPPAEPTVEQRRFLGLTRGLLGLASVQVVVGALVRGSVDIVAATAEATEATGGEPLARSEWLGQVGWLDFAHRKIALGILVLTLLSIVMTRRWTLPRDAARVASMNGAFVMLQILAGLALAYGGLPPAAQLVHITIGAWLVSGLYLQTLLLRDVHRRPVVAAPH